MSHLEHQFHPWHTLKRQDYLKLIEAAYACREYLFAAQVALDWLTDFPGDLSMRFWYGDARAKVGHIPLAANILDEVLQQDPEFSQALQTRIEIEKQISPFRDQNISSTPLKPTCSLSDYQEWLIALEGYDAPTMKRPYSPLEYRWGEEIYPIRKSLANSSLASNQSQYQELQNQLKAILGAKPTHPLVAITHLKSLYLSYKADYLPLPVLRQLVEHYLRAFPNCLYVGYVAVETFMDNGENEKAVTLLHSLAARDLTAQVAHRLWKKDHPLLGIWPKNLEKKLSIPIPANIATFFGWNQLPIPVSVPPIEEVKNAVKFFDDKKISPFPEKSNGRSNTSSEKVGKANSDATYIPATDLGSPTISEDLREIQEALNQIGTRLRQQNAGNIDGRQPAYIAMTNKRQLACYFTEEEIAIIEQAILKLLEAIQADKGWRGILYYVDEGLTPSNRKNIYRVEAVSQNDPWAIKRSLHQLDNLLAKQGEMIGALLIIGPHEIIPFHRLPNPLEDGDAEVFSDNPYGSRDENYLVMDWPVGRLPCSVKHIDEWLNSLENLTLPYLKKNNLKAKVNGYAKSLVPLVSWIHYLLSLFQPPTYTFSSFGYTAAAWRFASFAVFRQIGNPQSMLISPQLAKKMTPAENAKRRLVRHAKAFGTLEEVAIKTQTSPSSALSRTEQVSLPSVTAGYFNLHGLADSPEWFGQSDPTEDSGNLVSTADHPIALQPGDILLNPSANIEFIFSEACFGAHSIEKDASTSIALAFLTKGCRAFVGSTSTSYGSNGTPLIAADLLAYEFWKNLRQGLPAGECLRLAKLNMARELSKTYGYLDGEDQKTLTSFVLYGDPLAQVSAARSTPKVIRHSKSIATNIVSTCDHAFQPIPQELTPQLESAVKQLVAKYLPGIEFSNVEVLSESQTCSESCSVCHLQELRDGFPTQSSDHAKGKTKPSRKIIILTRQERRKEHLYTRYARLTLDEKGRLIKLSISR